MTDFFDEIFEKKKREEERRLWCDEEALAFSAARVPREVRVKFMRMLKSGKTIGEARDACNLNLAIACRIINENMDTHHSFSAEVR